MPTVLEEAGKLIHGERQQHYGPPAENLGNIAEFFSIYIHGRLVAWAREGEDPLDFHLDANDVCNLLVLLKTAREATGQGYHRDSTVDVCGYAALKEVMHGGT